MRRVIAVIATMMFVSIGFSREVFSQSSSAVEEQSLQSSSRNGNWSSKASAIVGHDSNVFRLSDRSVDRLKLGQPADDLSGRFRDMNEVDDALLDLDLAFMRKGVGLDGRDLDFVFEIGADLYSANSIKNSPHIEFEAIQDLAKGRELRARIGYEYGRFRRNYLYDATDLTGKVSEEERIYRSGEFNELAAAVEHRFRLWQKKKKQDSILKELGLRELECRVEAGVGRRQYDNFANRDRDTLSAKMQIVSRVGKDWRLGLSYHGRYINTPGGTEVLVLDEDDFGVDFNGDGDATDSNRRTEQRVDRDRIDHRVAADLRWQFAKSSELRLGYELMLQDYLSNEPFDLNNNGRTDTRHMITSRIEHKVAKSVFLGARATWMDEESDRRAVGDEDEESSYGRWQVFLTITAKF
ncbi:hypothetical protein N9B90_01790 [bacterium]|nr:hypothetical protein [bacterium]